MYSTIYSDMYDDWTDYFCKDCMRDAINKGYMLKEEQIERINGLAESGKISEVEFIDRESISKEFSKKVEKLHKRTPVQDFSCTGDS